MKTMTKWMTSSEAADYCRCPEKTIIEHAKRRRITACKSLDGKGWLFTIEDLDRFIEDRVNR